MWKFKFNKYSSGSSKEGTIKAESHCYTSNYSKYKKMVVNCLLLVLAGAGLGIYLFCSSHHHAMAVSLKKYSIPFALKLRTILYVFSGCVLVPVAAVLLKKYANQNELETGRFKQIHYGFFPFILLVFSVIQIKFPGTIIFFRFFFIVLIGLCFAYSGYLSGQTYIQKASGRTQKMD